MVNISRVFLITALLIPFISFGDASGWPSTTATSHLAKRRYNCGEITRIALGSGWGGLQEVVEGVYNGLRCHAAVARAGMTAQTTAFCNAVREAPRSLTSAMRGGVRAASERLGEGRRVAENEVRGAKEWLGGSVMVARGATWKAFSASAEAHAVGWTGVDLKELQAENDATVAAVLSVVESDGWDRVAVSKGVRVDKKFMPPPTSSASRDHRDGGEGEGEAVVDAVAAAKFACVKAVGTLDAKASEVYELFLTNDRVHEYNDNCKEVKDLEYLSPDTKVTWAASPRYGPFKARDFVTIVHYRTLSDGTMIVVNRPVEHPKARRSGKYVRAEILIASNIMRPNRLDPSKTDFISVTHINPGGIVDSALGASIVNALCAQAPVKLLMSLERAANAPRPITSTAVPSV